MSSIQPKPTFDGHDILAVTAPSSSLRSDYVDLTSWKLGPEYTTRAYLKHFSTENGGLDSRKVLGIPRKSKSSQLSNALSVKHREAPRNKPQTSGKSIDKLLTDYYVVVKSSTRYTLYQHTLETREMRRNAPDTAHIERVHKKLKYLALSNYTNVSFSALDKASIPAEVLAVFTTSRAQNEAGQNDKKAVKKGVDAVEQRLKSGYVVVARRTDEPNSELVYSLVAK